MLFAEAQRMPDYRVLQCDLDAIRATGLIDSTRWAVWRAEDRGPGRKPAKEPLNPRGYRIGSNNPAKWATFDQVANAYRTGKFDGIGVLVSSLQTVVGLDLDGVLADGGEVIAEAAEVVADFVGLGGYCEISPSGNGLRQFARGVLLEGFREKTTVCGGCSLEIYDQGMTRYLTLTGVPFPVGEAARPVVAAQAAIEAFQLKWGERKAEAGIDTGIDAGADDSDSLTGWIRRTDDEVLQLLFGRLNPQGRYTRLMQGETTDYDDDQSAARFALLTQLAYITRDDEQIERIVRLSSLDAGRFDEKRNGYRNRLHYDIARALKAKDRNFDLDQAAKEAEKAVEKARTTAFHAKVSDRLHGGCDDLLDSKGKLRPGMHTLAELLIRDKRLLGVMWFDEFSGLPKKSISFFDAFGDRCAPKSAGQIEDDDLLAVAAWVRIQWQFVAEDRNTLVAAVRRWARATSLNMTLDKLQGFANDWDGVKRLDTWLVDYMGVEPRDDNHAHYLGEVGKRFLIGVVARAFKPGTQQDQMLILENPDGGEGKSAAVRILARAIDESVFLEGFSPNDSKDCLMLMRGKLLGEWGELVGFDRRESDQNKNFLTRTQDEYRDPYGALNKVWPRTISFIATCNCDDYLRDLGGRRRYWPVRVGTRIDLKGLQEDAPHLWAEAVLLYQAGARFWVDRSLPEDARFRALCDAEQRKRLTHNAYDDLALDLADRLVHGMVHLDDLGIDASEWTVFSVRQMQRLLLTGSNDTLDRKEWQAMAAALKRCGWSNGEEFKLAGNNRGWGLTREKAEELRRLHKLGSAPPKPTRKEERAIRKAMSARETIS